MKIQNLNGIEIREINGGIKDDYNLGLAIGKHIKAGIEAFGKIVDALSPFS